MPNGYFYGQKPPGAFETFMRGLASYDPIGGIVGSIQAGPRRSQWEQDRAALVDMAVNRLETMGTPQASAMAQQFRKDPRSAWMHIQQFGGFPQFEQQQQAIALRQRAGNVVNQYLSEVHTGETIADPMDIYSRLREAQVPHEVAATTAEQIGKLSEPRQRGALKEYFDPTSETGTRLGYPEEAAGKPGKPASSMYIETPEGLKIRMGGRGRLEEGEALMPTPATLNRLQQENEQKTGRLYRLKLIGESMRPEFHNIPYRLGITLSEWHEKWTKETDPTIKKSIADYAVYIRRGYQEMNQTLRDMSGVAVNPQEAERLKKAMIDLGEHWWEGDSWSKARAKYLDGVMYVARDKARTMYMLQHPGEISAGSFSLDQAYRLVVDYGDKVWNRIKETNPTLTDDAIRNLVDAEVVQEFGVTYNDVRDPRGWQ